jgi:hypothetical protein
MHHGLFVTALVVPQRTMTNPGTMTNATLISLAGLVTLGLRLHQCLTESGDVAVAEDAETPRDQTILNLVTLGVLAREELHDGLRDRQSDRLAHPRPPKGSRGSTF